MSTRVLGSLLSVGAFLFVSVGAPFAVAHATTESWSVRTPLPMGREGMAGAFIGGNFYVSHGFAPLAGGDSTIFASYNPVTNAWTPLPPAAVARSELAGAAAIGPFGAPLFFAIGGRGAACFAAPVCAEVEAYNPAAGAWLPPFFPPMPTPRAGLGTAVVNNLVFAIGGRMAPAPYAGVPLPIVEVLDPTIPAWFPAPPLPIPVMDIYAVTALGSRIYVLGGFDGVSETNAVQIFDTTTGLWSFGPPMPTPRSNAVAGVCGGHIYVAGGTIGGGAPLGVVEELDPATSAWSTAPPMPTAANEMAASQVSGAGVIMTSGSGIFGMGAATNYALSCDVASCEAHGLIVRETDLSGAAGSSETDLSRSAAATDARPGAWPTAGTTLAPPASPQARANATQAHVAYSNPLLGLRISASSVFSRCDVSSAADADAGLFTHAYGRAGAADLKIDLGSQLLALEAADFELSAAGVPAGSTALAACDLAEVQVFAPPPRAAVCGPPTTTVLAVGPATVTITTNEEIGSATSVYSGAAVHVNVLVPGVTSVDVYVGAVEVGVTTTGAVGPIAYVPNAGCATSLCS